MERETTVPVLSADDTPLGSAVNMTAWFMTRLLRIESSDKRCVHA
jgi:hypothetical protein